MFLFRTLAGGVINEPAIDSSGDINLFCQSLKNMCIKNDVVIKTGSAVKEIMTENNGSKYVIFTIQELIMWSLAIFKWLSGFWPVGNGPGARVSVLYFYCSLILFKILVFIGPGAHLLSNWSLNLSGNTAKKFFFKKMLVAILAFFLKIWLLLCSVTR